MFIKNVLQGNFWANDSLYFPYILMYHITQIEYHFRNQWCIKGLTAHIHISKSTSGRSLWFVTFSCLLPLYLNEDILSSITAQRENYLWQQSVSKLVNVYNVYWDLVTHIINSDYPSDHPPSQCTTVQIFHNKDRDTGCFIWNCHIGVIRMYIDHRKTSDHCHV